MFSLMKSIQELKYFFQVQDMIQWGWKLEGSRMQPTVIDIEPVPGNLLKFTKYIN